MLVHVDGKNVCFNGGSQMEGDHNMSCPCMCMLCVGASSQLLIDLICRGLSMRESLDEHVARSIHLAIDVAEGFDMC